LRLMHIADLHLGAPLGNLGDSARHRCKERDSIFPRIVDAAIEKADILIISGDLFDRHDPDEALAGMVRSELRRLKDNKVLALVVPGNHDEITYTRSTYKDLSWDDCCKLVRTPTPWPAFRGDVAGLDVYVCSCAYTGGVTRREDLKDLKRVPDGAVGILAMHCSLDMDLPGADEDRAMKVSSKDIEASGYSYAALGHIHKPIVRTSGKLTMVYPGLLDGMGFNDIGTGRYPIAEFNGSDVRLSWEDMPGLAGYSALELDITGMAPEDAASRVRSKAQGAAYLLVRLTGTMQASFSPIGLRSALAPYFSFVQVESDALHLDPFELDNMAKENTLRGSFTRRMLGRLESCGEEEKGLVEAALKKGLEALRQEVQGR